MILGYYAGYLETDLDKAFRYVAWGSQYGGSIQFDPIFGCISHFLRRAHDKGVWIQTPFVRSAEKHNWNRVLEEQTACIFVLAGEAGEISLEQIVNHVVDRGSNLVFLFSRDVSIRAEEHREKEKVEAFFSDFHKLTQTTHVDVSDGRTVKLGNGRILFIDAERISDAIIEPGPFEGWSLEKILKGIPVLDQTIEQISSFSLPYVDCHIRGLPTTWPRDESIIFEIEVQNYSEQTIENIDINLSLDQYLEPLSLINLQIDTLKAKASRTVTCIVVPRSKGIFENPISVELKFGEIRRHIPLESVRLEILDPLPKLLLASKPYSVDLTAVLPLYEPHFVSVVSATILLSLIKADPSSVVQKARQVGEYIVRKIASVQLADYKEKWDFAIVNTELYKQGKISAKSKGYIDTVRTIGNLASHPSSTNFAEEDAVTICQTLVLFLDECRTKHLI